MRVDPRGLFLGSLSMGVKTVEEGLYRVQPATIVYLSGFSIDRLASESKLLHEEARQRAPSKQLNRNNTATAKVWLVNSTEDATLPA